MGEKGEGFTGTIIKDTWTITSWGVATGEKRKQNITRDIEVKNNLTIVKGECGGESEERGLQELL